MKTKRGPLRRRRRRRQKAKKRYIAKQNSSPSLNNGCVSLQRLSHTPPYHRLKISEPSTRTFLADISFSARVSSKQRYTLTLQHLNVSNLSSSDYEPGKLTIILPNLILLSSWIRTRRSNKSARRLLILEPDPRISSCKGLWRLLCSVKNGKSKCGPSFFS